MPVLNRAAELQDEIAGWRRQIHQHPETMFAVEKTAAFVAERLKEFGVDEIVTGIGRPSSAKLQRTFAETTNASPVPGRGGHLPDPAPSLDRSVAPHASAACRSRERPHAPVS